MRESSNLNNVRHLAKLPTNWFLHTWNKTLSQGVSFSFKIFKFFQMIKLILKREAKLSCHTIFHPLNLDRSCSHQQQF